MAWHVMIENDRATEMVSHVVYLDDWLVMDVYDGMMGVSHPLTCDNDAPP